MASGYDLIVKKDLDKNRVGSLPPEYIQRGWQRVYTLDEQRLNKVLWIIGSDVQVPNSIVRRRLSTTKILKQANINIFRKVFELPNELLMYLSNEHPSSNVVEEKQLLFDWNDEDNNKYDSTHNRFSKMHQYDNTMYNDDDQEPLSMDDLIKTIRTKVTKDLNNEESNLISNLMKIIDDNKTNQIMNIYNVLMNLKLINKVIPTANHEQVLQEIRKAFEQVVTKANIMSMETVINALLDNDDTYRIAKQLSNSFHEKYKKQKQRYNVQDKSSYISNYDQTIFDIFIKDHVSRLSTSDLSRLMQDLKVLQSFNAAKIISVRDDQVRYIVEQLNNVFLRAHLNGIKDLFRSIQSPVSITLANSIDTIENSLKHKLSEYDHMIIESYIVDCLMALADYDLKTIYEQFVQYGILQRTALNEDINQMITINLMNKINENGLSIVIENMKKIQLDNDHIIRLIESLINIDQYLHSSPAISLEQIRNQLDMSYFTEVRNLNKTDTQDLLQAACIYSMIPTHIPNEPTDDEVLTLLEHLKAPFVRICIQRILNQIHQDSNININDKPSNFYPEHITNLFRELIQGSDEFNRNIVLYQTKKQLNKNKELLDRFWRQMLKENLMTMNSKMKVDSIKKKLTAIMNEMKEILSNNDNRTKQERLIILFETLDINRPRFASCIDRALPERVKSWYKTKWKTKTSQSSLSKTQAVHDSYNRKPIVNSVPSTYHTLKKSVTSQEKSNSIMNKFASKQKGLLPKAERNVQSRANPINDPHANLGHIRSIDEQGSDVNDIEQHQVDRRFPVSSKSEEQADSTSTTINNEATLIFSRQPNTKVENINSFDVEPHEKNSQFIEINKTAEMQNDIQSFENAAATAYSNIMQEPIKLPIINNEPEANVQVYAKADSNEITNVLPLLSPLKNTSFGTHSPSSVVTNSDIHQANVETVQQNTSMSEDQIVFLDSHPDAALLFYDLLTPHHSITSTNKFVSGQNTIFIEDSPMIKTKSQRLFASAIPTTTTTHQPVQDNQIERHSSLFNFTINSRQIVSDAKEMKQSIDSPAKSSEISSTPNSQRPSDNIKSFSKTPNSNRTKSIKQTEDIYMTTLTKALTRLFTGSEYYSVSRLQKLHEDLVVLGHISPLNEFYRSSSEALRETIDHCSTFNDLIKWALSLLQTKNKASLNDFGRDLYSIAIEVDFAFVEHVDLVQCSNFINENLKNELQTITQNNLREINSYLNASQFDKIIQLSKKLYVTSKDRMISDLKLSMLHLIQACHTFEPKYRPMQMLIREIADRFQSRVVNDLAGKLDDIEERLVKKFSITYFGLSKRMNDLRFVLIK